MDPNLRSFDKWLDIFFSSERESDEWWDAFDALPITAKTSEHWQEITRILINCEMYPLNHPAVVIATNGILMAPREEDIIPNSPSIFQSIKHLLKIKTAT